MDRTADPAADRAVDDHSRIVDTLFGRIVVGVVLVVGAFWIVAPNTPAGPLRAAIDAAFEPARNLGLEQDWGVFSPNARSISLDVRARLTYPDGSVATWDVPDLDPVVGAYREYRWNKWQERVRLDARADLWQPTAEWIAAANQRDGEPPVEVVLIRRWIDHEPLTAAGARDVPDDGTWNEFEFYVWTPDTGGPSDDLDDGPELEQ